MDYRALDTTPSGRGLYPRDPSGGEASEGGHAPLRRFDTGANLLKSDLVRKTYLGEE